MATPDTRFFTIPEANTAKVAKAVAGLLGLPNGKTERVKNLGPGEPDAVRFKEAGVMVSRYYGHREDGGFAALPIYRITIADGGIQAPYLSDQEIIEAIKRQRESRINIVGSKLTSVLHRLAPRNGHS